MYVRRLRRKFGLQVLECLLVFLPGVNVSIIFALVRVFHWHTLIIYAHLDYNQLCVNNKQTSNRIPLRYHASASH